MKSTSGLTFCLVLSALSSGCRSGVTASETHSGLFTIAHYYRQHAQVHGKSPSNEQELKEFMRKSEHGGPLAPGSDVDKLFVSPRDGQPYVIMYGKKPEPRPAPGVAPPIFAYEKVGAGGKRYVAALYALSTPVSEIDDATFTQWVPDAK